MRFQVTTHQTEQTSVVEPNEEKSQSSCGSRKMPSSTSKNGEPSKSRRKSPQAPSPKTTTDSPNRKSSCHNKHPPPHQKNTMDPMTKIHMVPSTRKNPAVRVASPCGSWQHLHIRSCLPPNGWRRSPT